MAETWSVVLAAGEGNRLRTLTTTRQGLVIPKQYCSINRSSCLLQDALKRAATVAMPSHVCTVVADQHRRWWTSAIAGLNESNVFVQPRDKGTAYGILLALLKLEMRNPSAIVTLLPADHYFRDEEAITRVLRIAGNLASANPDATYLLGTDPEGPDAALGYILPVEKALDKPAGIVGFTEKPTTDYARELLSVGALCNLFILAGSVGALLELFEEDYAEKVGQMREAMNCQVAGDRQSLDKFYASVAPFDFALDVLEVQATRLQVLRVPNCGWTDLGTPQRVEATVRRMGASGDSVRRHIGTNSPLFFDLAGQH